MPRFLDRLLGRPEHVREPRFDGHFYPSDPDALRALVTHHLEQAEPPQAIGPPKALIVPGCQLDLGLAVSAKAWRHGCGV